MRKDDQIAALQDIDILEEPIVVNTYRCHHGRIKCQCIPCDGSQICEHKRIRWHCKECPGSQICEHNRQRGIAKNVEVHKYVNTTDKGVLRKMYRFTNM